MFISHLSIAGCGSLNHVNTEYEGGLLWNSCSSKYMYLLEPWILYSRDHNSMYVVMCNIWYLFINCSPCREGGDIYVGVPSFTSGLSNT
jgi:hypothetical protein